MMSSIERDRQHDAGIPVEPPQTDNNRSSETPRPSGRGVTWEWNIRLFVASFLLALVVVGLAMASYLHYSSQAASTFRSRAEQSAEKQEYAEQAKWLRRYSLLKPGDSEAVVEMALAADSAAENAAPASRYLAIDQARKQIAASLVRLDGGELEKKHGEDLRRRLINRLIQLGGGWYREAERQIVLLDADRSDPQAHKWMAMSLAGQVNSSLYQERRADKFEKHADYWEWLSYQKVGEAIETALEHNENDLDLLATLLGLYGSDPEQFEQRGDDPEYRKRQLEDRIAKKLIGIRSNQDSRSRLVLYQFDLGRGGDVAVSATKKLLDASEEAVERLDAVDQSMVESAKSIGTSETPPEFYWDYLLVVEAVGRNGDPQVAAKWYDQLMRLDVVGLIPAGVIENVYMKAAQLAFQQNNSERTIEILKQGLERVDPNSLELLGALAMGLDAEQDPKQYQDIISRFRKAIEDASGQIARATEQSFSLAGKRAFSKNVDDARWRLSILDASKATEQGDTAEAIQLLKSALDRVGSIPQNEYLRVVSQLATMYGQEGLWDQAAIVLDKAIMVAPNNPALRVQAAEASLRSGNRQQALEKWRVAGSFDSLDLQVAAAQAEFEFQLRRISEDQDFSGVRAALSRIRASYEKLKPAERKISQTSANKLALLKVLLPPSGTSANDYFSSPRMIDAIIELGETYPEQVPIQVFVAERLASMGHPDDAEKAFARIVTSQGVASSIVATIRARVDAANGEYLAASKRMADQAEIDQTNSAQFRRYAAAFALRGESLETAYHQLSTIASEDRSISDLVSLANVARAMPKESQVFAQAETPESVADRWEKELRKREGAKPSNAEFLKVTRLIEELRMSEAEIEQNDPRLSEARDIIENLLVWRPRWGKAISLEGWLLAIEGKPEKAVEYLRRGIVAGDQRVQTRQRLWEQLILLNRDVEAEQEMRAMSIASDTSLDKYATTQISLAIRQGDYARSLEVAETTMKERPTDFLSYVVYGRTATVAAVSSKSPEERSKLLRRAEDAIEKATEYAKEDEPAIFAARMRLRVATEDKDGIREELSRIEDSRLDEDVKWLMMSHGYVTLGEYDKALPLLERADRVNPSTATRLKLAEVYRRLHRPDDEVEALRKAQRSSPHDSAIRNQLAHALAVRDGKNVNWDELSRLLSSSEGSTVSNRLYYAILLSQHGDEAELDEATKILRELVRERNRGSEDATRVLAALLRKRADDEGQGDTKQAWISEIRSSYESLRQLPAPEVTDLHRYADFLLSLNEKDDLPTIRKLQKELNLMDGGSVASLDVAIRFVEKIEGREGIPAVVKTWSEHADDDPMFKDDPSSVPTYAGAALLKLDFIDEALAWFKQAYTKYPNLEGSATLKNYVVALIKAERYRDSIDVTGTHFQEHEDLDSARLYVESLINDVDQAEQPKRQELLDLAVDKFGGDAVLLESVGTLRLQQQRFEDAIDLYRKVQEIDPFRVRSLNNLAMALSEIPEQAASGVQWIDRAIKLAGEHPELLDTKGVVLLRAGQLQQALQVFEQAIAQSDEQRYQFHLIVTLQALNKEQEAKKAWEDLDLSKLDPSGLTSSEQESLQAMKQEFAAEKL